MPHRSAHRPPAARQPDRAGRTLAVAAVAIALVATCAACSSDSGDDASSPGSGSATTTTAPDGSPATSAGTDATGPDRAIVFNGQGNNLDAYAVGPGDETAFVHQRVWETVATDPEGRDINAQICFLPPTDDGEQWYIAGEDTLQDAEGSERRPAGWGIFRIEGTEVGNLTSTQIGKLTTTFQSSNDNPENYGCGVLPDGRILTTDVGNQAGGDGDGQLIIWFPPFTGGEYPTFDEVAHCKLDVGLATAQSILVRGDEVFVASSRGDVYRYTGPFPTSDDAAGGCGKEDPTGSPLAEEVRKEVFIDAGPNQLATPAGLAPASDGGMYVSSVFNGVINEYDADGSFRRTVLQPPEGEGPGPEPISTGTPLGICVDDEGSIWYADIGIVVTPGNVGPGDHTGSVRRIRFEGGEPLPPEVVAADLEFPDGIGVWLPGGGGGAESKA